MKRFPCRVVAVFSVAAFFAVSCEKPPASDITPSPPAQSVGKVSVIAFGSCAHQDKSQPIWAPISAENPELFIFAGDNIYGDTEDMTVMRAKYDKLSAIPGFKQLRSNCPVIGVWDDHDYGINDGGSEYSNKEGAEAEYHRFFDTPANSPSLSRPGTYDSRVFGEKGSRLQVILLDTRYFRGPLVKLKKRSSDGPYDRNRDPKATILGEAQWKWLEAVLKEEADFRIIVSSIQAIPQDHRWELWENMPLERARLFKLLGTTGASNTAIISGDRHMAEISELKTTDPISPGFPVIEVTSSGLTNAGGGKKNETNRHRISSTNFQSRNYGMIRINWEAKSARFEVRDVEGKEVFNHNISFGK